LRKVAAQEPSAVRGTLSTANTMPYILDCVRAYATVGEICAALREVMGTYTEVSIA
ncbi:MAG: bhbA1, partial [Acidobacteriaceae bacterium]|nr:bhbA1 [Acidobacteriaceae bacterium]